MIDSPSARLRSIKRPPAGPSPVRSPRPGRLLTIPELALALATLRKRTRSGSTRDVEMEEALGRDCYAATVETSKEVFFRRQRVRGQPDQEQLLEAQWATVVAYGEAWQVRQQQAHGLERF